jgi:flagellar basal body-associated protein FliL
MENNQEQQGTAKKRKVSGLALFLIVVVLIAAGFGSGALLVFLKLRGAEASWNQEKAGYEASLASQAAELAVVKSRETLLGLYEGLTSVYIDLTEKNFGLAREKIAQLTVELSKAPAELDAATKAKLEPLMAEIAQGAEALDSGVKTKAREARELLLKIVGK